MGSVHPATPWVCGMRTPKVWHPSPASAGWSSHHPRVPATLPPYGNPDLGRPRSACLQGPAGTKGVRAFALSSSYSHAALLALSPRAQPWAILTGPPIHGLGDRPPICSAPFPFLLPLASCTSNLLPGTPSSWKRGVSSTLTSRQALEAQGAEEGKPSGCGFRF